MHTVLKSASKTVIIGHDQPFCIIGERINPTGRKKFQSQLRVDDLSQLAIDIEQQVRGGADVLDVNMGVPLTDEPALPRLTVETLLKNWKPPNLSFTSSAYLLLSYDPSIQACPYFTLA